MKKNKNEKKEYIDDGHTIYDMNVDADWNTRSDNKKVIPVPKDDQRALIKAAFIAYTPKLLMVLFGFALAIVVIYLWLK